MNLSQRKSICLFAHHQNPLGLIQGPPGTGKTHTITELIRNLKFNYFPELLSQNDIDLYKIFVEETKDGSFYLASDYCPCLNKILSKINCRPSGRETGILIGKRNWTLILKSQPGKILVCAPSNCAVDELMQRVIESKIFPAEAIIRFGTLTESTPKSVLERHVEQIIAKFKENLFAKRRPEISHLKHELRSLMGLGHDQNELYEDNGFGVNENIQKIEDKTNEIFNGPTKNLIQFLTTNLNQVVWKILKVEIGRAKVVFTTLNSSGSNRLRELVMNPEVMILDEACQSTEVQSLVPLGLSPKKLIFVGDHRQLPATTFLYNSQLLGFEISLFERLVKMGHYVHMLQTQYRMVPELSTFISNHFYLGKLNNGSNVQILNLYLSANYSNSIRKLFFKNILDLKRSTLKKIIWFFDHYKLSTRVIANKPNFSQNEFLKAFNRFLEYLHPTKSIKKEDSMASKINLEFLKRSTGFYFFDVKGVTIRYRKSFKNDLESNAVSEIVSFFSSYKVYNIGVISPYKAQTHNIRRDLKFLSVPRGEKGLEINTIDGFQGKQKEVIIISCVKSFEKKSHSNKGNLCTVGFLDDPRRGNVALSRAKYGVFILGNREVLQKSAGFWIDLLGVLDSEGRSFQQSQIEGVLLNKRDNFANGVRDKMVLELFLDVCEDLQKSGKASIEADDHKRDPSKDGSEDGTDKDDENRSFYYKSSSKKKKSRKKRRSSGGPRYNDRNLRKRDNFKFEEGSTGHNQDNIEGNNNQTSMFSKQLKKNLKFIKMYNFEMEKAIENTRKWQMLDSGNSDSFKSKDQFTSYDNEFRNYENYMD